MQSLGEAVTQLPWLAPSAASLGVLARPGQNAWLQLRCDPGFVLLLARQVRSLANPGPFSTAWLRDPAVLHAAVHFLDGPGFVDWDQPAVVPIHRAAINYARTASLLAGRSGRADPDIAWLAGMLAPLGWLGVAAVSREAAGNCLADPDHAQDPARCEQRRWGLDSAALTRRLARRWQLPSWLQIILGHLALPGEVAAGLGAESDLFRIIQLAVQIVEQQDRGLRLQVPSVPVELEGEPGLSTELRDAVLPAEPTIEPDLKWTNPASVPLLRDLLLLAEEQRRLSSMPALEELERDLDRLHRCLLDRQASEDHRLHEQKLGTLAEFAAGAAHEINNPLAVISGQAQYLLRQAEQCPDDESDQEMLLVDRATFVDSCRTIIGQAQRIHEILTQLMQFSRPSRPQKQPVHVAALIDETAAGLANLAEQRRVRLICPPAEQSLAVHADPRQLRLALTALLRNAIEAAPPEGWAGVRVEVSADHRIELIVEDSGPGPGPAQQRHMFDPFYSGRSAGRGRGLGLPTAWRLAREHGGDVRFAPQPNAPTRFVLSLPHFPTAAANNGRTGYTPVNNGEPIASAAPQPSS